MIAGSVDEVISRVLHSTEHDEAMTPDFWSWLVDVWVAPAVVATGAVLFAVWLSRRYELLGTPRAARRKRWMNSAAKAYERSTRLKRRIPYTEPDIEPEPIRGWWWLRHRLWWLEYRQQRLFDLIVDEHRQDFFHTRLDEHFTHELDSTGATEAQLGGIVAEELLRRAGEISAKRQRRWWRGRT